MLTKKIDLKKIREEILELYIKDKSQEEIQRDLKKKHGLKPRKLKELINENAYLSPKNIKYSAVLAFFIAYAAPGYSIYLRGYEYAELVRPIFALSLFFSSPFLVFAIWLYLLQDIRTIKKTSFFMLVYYLVYLIVLTTIAIDLQIWTILVFPALLFPTMVMEWIKLDSLIQKLGKKINT